MSMNAVVDFPVRPEARPYLDAFARRPSGEPKWLGARRRRGLARFAEQGFPNRRSEAWRYIDLRALAEKPMLPAGAAGTSASAAIHDRLAEVAFAGAACRLVLVDRPDLVRSAIETSLFDAERPFAALNAAFFGDGFVLDIPPAVTLDRPIEIVHLASGGTD